MAFLHSDVPSDGHSGHSTGNLQSGGPPSLFCRLTYVRLSHYPPKKNAWSQVTVLIVSIMNDATAVFVFFFPAI